MAGHLRSGVIKRRKGRKTWLGPPASNDYTTHSCFNINLVWKIYWSPVWVLSPEVVPACEKQIASLGDKILVDFLSCLWSLDMNWPYPAVRQILEQPLICSGLGWWVKKVFFCSSKPQQWRPSSSKLIIKPGEMWPLPAELCSALLSCAGEGSWMRDDDYKIL